MNLTVSGDLECMKSKQTETRGNAPTEELALLCPAGTLPVPAAQCPLLPLLALPDTRSLFPPGVRSPCPSRQGRLKA